MPNQSRFLLDYKKCLKIKAIEDTAQCHPLCKKLFTDDAEEESIQQLGNYFANNENKDSILDMPLIIYMGTYINLLSLLSC